ncbi:hypothetical protein [Kineosporia babensis]|uniref:Uncharacterized protein n=1 Tax=Kineosporia babensis TaxID=499548 RepID=A0A9X1NK30_9ACTN|nr:hypothetical protein [Kineosporia babensis]MCD5315608.1 hypothetical protein [Kineosporia babensis]
MQSRLSVRYRRSISTVRVSAIGAGTLALTAATELLVVLTARSRAQDGGFLDAVLGTCALAVAPLITMVFAVLWLRRSVLNYRQLLTETCFWVVVCDALVVLLSLQGR